MLRTMRSAVDELRDWLVTLSTPAKRTIALCVDLILIWVALWMAFFIRLGDSFLVNPLQYYWLFLVAPALAFPVFIRLGLYRAVLRYIGRDAVITIFNAVTLAALLLALVVYLARSELLIPRSMVFNYWLLLLLMVGGVRFSARAFFVQSSLFRFSRFRNLERLTPGRHRVAIYGAGTAGFQLFSALQSDRSVLPVAFLDDDPNLKGRSISGVRVYSPERMELMLRDTGAEEVFLAMPSLSPKRRRAILERLEPYPIHVRTVPSINELATGRKQVNNLQEVGVQDILGREVVKPVVGLMEKCIRDQAVVVTGAGGSIGAELCRQILSSNPRRLILFDHSEFNLVSIEDELRAQVVAGNLSVQLICVLGSVLNPVQLKNVMRRFEVDTVYHAAAYKHVPMVEQNITAGLRNNVFGTLYTAQAAVEAGVSNFVLVSTDKAVRPTNVMGATKRLAEMILQALADEQRPELMAHAGYRPDTAAVNMATRFTMVRFGNVIDSSGSVIPRFRRQIQQGGPLTVTHPNITRYFMTIPEASQLVIQAGSMGRGGELFVLDMGQPVKIVDLAVKMVHLAGLSVCDERNPQGDIQIRFTGLRPGEKLYEELLIGKDVEATEHPKIKRAFEEKLSWEELKTVLTAIQNALDNADVDTVRALLVAHIHGFQPHQELVDSMMDQPLVQEPVVVEQPADGRLH